MEQHPITSLNIISKLMIKEDRRLGSSPFLIPLSPTNNLSTLLVIKLCPAFTFRTLSHTSSHLPHLSNEQKPHNSPY